jgi:hypothetical protein
MNAGSSLWERRTTLALNQRDTCQSLLPRMKAANDRLATLLEFFLSPP